MEHLGKYEIREQIGRGGMGAVYRAYDPVMEREVAIKVILDIALDVPEIKERFYREARTAGKLTHENITIIHDVGEEKGRPYIVMEYLPGSDLRTLLERHTAMTMRQRVSIAVQICRGLAYSHGKEIIHRDVKPANIRILENGRVKIMDFGIARLGSSALTATGAIMGTPYYMSPEQIQGKKVDRRSDIFSCGVVLYELFTSHKPFTGEEPTSVMYKIVHEAPEGFDELPRLFPPALPAILERMLQKDPLKRFQSIDEVVDAFEELDDALRKDRHARGQRTAVSTSREESPAHGGASQETSTMMAAGPASTPAAPSARVSDGDGKPPEIGPAPGTRTRRRVSRTLIAQIVLGGLIAAAVVIYLMTPAAPPTGTLMLNILPWAYVTAIEHEQSGPVALADTLTTPCRIALSPGNYALTCTNPNYTRPFRVRLTITADSIVQVIRTWPGYNIETALAQF